MGNTSVGSIPSSYKVSACSFDSASMRYTLTVLSISRISYTIIILESFVRVLRPYYGQAYCQDSLSNFIASNAASGCSLAILAIRRALERDRTLNGPNESIDASKGLNFLIVYFLSALRPVWSTNCSLVTK